PVILTEQYPKGLGPTVSEIREILPSAAPVEKMSFNCCEEPSFMREIKYIERKTLLLAGMEAHICVLQTCLSLLRDGFTVHVIRDAVCSRTKANWETGLAFMHDAGAVITSTETVLFQVLKKAGTEDFKAISQRIK
ncbi:MAG: isochorismatase family protein, partial [Thermodesulfovibrionales bacterium]